MMVRIHHYPLNCNAHLVQLNNYLKLIITTPTGNRSQLAIHGMLRELTQYITQVGITDYILFGVECNRRPILSVNTFGYFRGANPRNWLDE